MLILKVHFFGFAIHHLAAGVVSSVVDFVVDFLWINILTQITFVKRTNFKTKIHHKIHHAGNGSRHQPRQVVKEWA